MWEGALLKLGGPLPPLTLLLMAAAGLGGPWAVATVPHSQPLVA